MFLKHCFAMLLGIFFICGSAQAEGILSERIKERVAEKRDDSTVPESTNADSAGGSKGIFRQRLEDGAGRDVTKSQFGSRFGEKMESHRSNSKGEHANINGLQVAVWSPADGREHAPLVIFSHGFNGCNTQSKFLMAALADKGFLVLAPNHKDNKCGRMAFERSDVSFKNPEQWSDVTYADRKQDIERLIAGLQADPSWNRAIDWQRVALAGHSLGGYTVLGLAGGWPSWKMRGIRAVLALSPYCAPYSDHGNLNLGIPVMYQGGTRDIGITPSVKRPGGCYDKTSSPAAFVEFKKAGHLAFTDLVGQFQDDINYYSVAFLSTYVMGDQGGMSKLPSVTDMRSK